MRVASKAGNKKNNNEDCSVVNIFKYSAARRVSIEQHNKLPKILINAIISQQWCNHISESVL